MPPFMFKKSNGAYVYDSTDLATIYERKAKYNPDHIIYVTDYNLYNEYKHLGNIYYRLDRVMNNYNSYNGSIIVLLFIFPKY